MSLVRELTDVVALLSSTRACNGRGTALVRMVTREVQRSVHASRRTRMLQFVAGKNVRGIDADSCEEKALGRLHDMHRFLMSGIVVALMACSGSSGGSG